MGCQWSGGPSQDKNAIFRIQKKCKRSLPKFRSSHSHGQTCELILWSHPCTDGRDAPHGYVTVK